MTDICGKCENNHSTRCSICKFGDICWHCPPEERKNYIDMFHAKIDEREVLSSIDHLAYLIHYKHNIRIVWKANKSYCISQHGMIIGKQTDFWDAVSEAYFKIKTRKKIVGEVKSA